MPRNFASGSENSNAIHFSHLLGCINVNFETIHFSSQGFQKRH
ncbi:hypothetical protein LEP1GSC202_0122 [Leptospira yanagawae serovar Saopaulo str. Sao Paulo = ATCC 700523]|uniref:Uncharacterized protein n=1 Tax=Leptospira yanagawae serovar Saopaulo str. Sao Paulo = ATCC 700523 TaxID=1249483 RepID=A0A5E8H7G8_9LEPT|nr:hypothetical protein LEP1GSC202_0122 [Leptospira yanagawae serovar Saopaulo str. Sao Paulo = ATCC 700523]